MSRARGPQRPRVDQAEVRSASCAEPSAGRWSASHLWSAIPCAPPGDDAEVLVAEPHDRQVGLEAAARREPRRVDDASDGRVDLAHRHRLQRVERTGPGDVEDRERREVEDPRAVAHREVLGVDDRRPPARVPLGLAPPDPVAVLLEQRRVRLVPLRTLPARRLEEDGAELLLALVVRRQPDVAVRRPLLERVDDPVRLVEPLAGSRLHVRGRLLVLPEARRIGGVEVDVRLAVHHPLGERLSDSRPLLDPDRRGRPEPLHLRQLAEDRHPVGREREDPVDRVLDADGLVADDRRHQLECLLHLQR